MGASHFVISPAVTSKLVDAAPIVSLPLRIETVLVNESPYINQAVALGSGEDFVSVLIYPDFANLRTWAEEHNVVSENLTADPAVRALYAAELDRVNPLIEIKYERVRRAVLAERVPSLENGELTPSGKLVRKTVLDNFKDKVEGLLARLPSAEVIKVPQEAQRTVSSEA